MLSDTIYRKFIDIINLKNWQVRSENGWNDIDSINKTEKYEEYKITFSDGTIIYCADTHIFIDIIGMEVFAYDSLGCTFVNKNDDIIDVVEVKRTDKSKHMYDLSLAEGSDHLYYTNNVLSHNSTTYCMFILWYLIFNPEKKVLIAANKKDTSLEILSRVQLAYEMLPNWIKPGLFEYNKSKVKFGNLSEITAVATASDSARGTSCNVLILDEFAFAEQPEKFWNSVYPIVSSDKNSKVIIVSTPNGVGNLFHKLWDIANSQKGENSEGWVPFRVDWWEVPERDEKWKQQQIASLGNIESFNQEFGNSFISSSWKKLIGDEQITKFKQLLPLYKDLGEDVSVNPNDVNCSLTYTRYHRFDPRCTYLASGDSSEGTGGDASVLYIFDITNTSNIKLCAKFSNNKISTTEFAYVINFVCKQYMNPYLAIERNTTGGAVLDALCSTIYSYENVIIMNKHNKPGIMSHMQIKQKACLWVRDLFSYPEFNIELADEKLITEMDTFIKKDTSQHVVYSAMVKKHDDHIMCLIWAMYILNNENVDKYYNVVTWKTTSLGKTLPEFIAPLNSYDIAEREYNKMVNELDNSEVVLPEQFKMPEIKQVKDRFFGDDEESEWNDEVIIREKFKELVENKRENFDGSYEIGFCL